MRNRIYFDDPRAKQYVDVAVEGQNWSAVTRNEFVPLPTQEMLEYKARHGGDRNELALTKICLIMRRRGYQLNGERPRH